MHIHTKGRLSELAAMQQYIEWGYVVYDAVLPKCKADFIAIDEESGRVVKVQVKTVSENTVGGITYLQSRTSVKKNLYLPHEVDEFFFLHQASGRKWVATLEGLQGNTSVNFGRLDGKVQKSKSKTTIQEI